MDKNNWLAKVREDIIEPERPICDPHHHLWDHPGSRYLIDEIHADVCDGDGDGHNVVSTVFVECSAMYRSSGPDTMKPIGETEFVQGIAAMSEHGQYGSARVARGIVSYADLTLGEGVLPVLEAHIAASPNRFRGIRHAAGWHADERIRNSHTNPPPGLFMRDDFREGFGVLTELQLSFDAWCYHPQIPELVDLARAFPDAIIVLDHFGGPLGVGPFQGKQDEVFDDWRRSVEPLAALSNVFFKLGGINMKINGFDWHKRDKPPTSDELVEATSRYYNHCIELAGSDRCMFESNFPVDKDSCSYHVLWNAFKKMAAGRSEEEKQQLFHDTAARAYRLN